MPFNQRTNGTSVGKPLSSKVEADILELSHFINEDPWSIFKLLKIGKNFIKDPVEEW